jgi:hypothetical protein
MLDHHLGYTSQKPKINKILELYFLIKKKKQLGTTQIKIFTTLFFNTCMQYPN